MKKYIIVVSLIIFLALMAGCSLDPNAIQGSGNIITSDYDIDDFNNIKSSNNFEVSIEQADTYKVEIYCDDNILEYLDVKKQNGTLVIGLEELHNYQNITLEAKVSVPDLERIEGTGSSEINLENGLVLEHDFELILSGASSLKGNFQTQDMKVRLSGASKASGTFTVDDLILSLVGASDVSFKGSGSDLKCNLAGSSDAELFGLAVNNAHVILEGASISSINVDSEIILDASGSSTLFYKGNGIIESINLSGDSKVEKIK